MNILHAGDVPVELDRAEQLKLVQDVHRGAFKDNKGEGHSIFAEAMAGHVGVNNSIKKLTSG